MRARSNLPFEVETQDNLERMASDKKRVAALCVQMAVDAVDLARLAAYLDVDVELDELVGTSPERQRLLREARVQLGLQLDIQLSDQTEVTVGVNVNHQID